LAATPHKVQSSAKLGGLMGDATAKAIEEMVRSADNRSAGIVATVVGVATLIVTATGVFGEVQSSMNAIWKAKPRSSTLSRQVRARLASLGLVLTSGFLLTVSLVVSAALGGPGVSHATLARALSCSTVDATGVLRCRCRLIV
jgi:membrane protein